MAHEGGSQANPDRPLKVTDYVVRTIVVLGIVTGLAFAAIYMVRAKSDGDSSQRTI